MSQKQRAVLMKPEDCRKQVRVVLQQAVDDLRKTKDSYKCKEVARVRKNLEEILKELWVVLMISPLCY